MKFAQGLNFLRCWSRRRFQTRVLLYLVPEARPLNFMFYIISSELRAEDANAQPDNDFQKEHAAPTIEFAETKALLANSNERTA